MMTFLEVIGAIAMVGVGWALCWFVIYKGLMRFMKRLTDKELREFMAAFPGRCPVCAHYEYGLMYGLAKPGTRPAHVCLLQGKQ